MTDRRPAGPVPDATHLREAALNYLARYAATEAALRRVLERRVDRWARQAEAEAGADTEAIAGRAATARTVAREVASGLAAAGAVNDAAYAESRGRSLLRAGRSRRAAAAHLAAKGVDAAIARSALPEDEHSELAAALVLLRRRRIGPFRQAGEPDPKQLFRELGILARAGFPQDLARRALAMETEEAESLVINLRR